MTVPIWLPLAILLALGASTFARIVALRRAGIAAVAIRTGDDAHAFLGRAFAGLLIGMFLFCAAYAGRPTVIAYFGSLDWLRNIVVAWIGAALMLAGMLLAIAAQFAMGRSWRIGVHGSDATALVSEGAYRFSRNPIYLGVMAAMAGVFLIAPNAATLALSLAAWIAISAQVRLEEDFLSKRHGEAYAAYCARTRRWC